MTGTSGPLRIGTLGAARIAPAAIVKPAREVDEAELTAVAARDPAKAAKFAKKHDIPRVHETYEALLADDQIDAVYNPLPNGLHGVWTRRALDAGKHVLCEKPLTANADEAEEVAAAAGTSPAPSRSSPPPAPVSAHPRSTGGCRPISSGPTGAPGR